MISKKYVLCTTNFGTLLSPASWFAHRPTIVKYAFKISPSNHNPGVRRRRKDLPRIGLPSRSWQISIASFFLNLAFSNRSVHLSLKCWITGSFASRRPDGFDNEGLGGAGAA